MEQIQKALDKLESKISNGIREWIAKTTVELSVLEEDHKSFESDLKEISNRVTKLEVSSGALKARQTTIMVIITVIITAAINLLFQR
ncbi:MAG: hypothetical protein HXS54_06325 [Theionarchaea archaeon]|nr:hypothetical protein [Theionarchaea archaeon]DBA34875.1 TPA_asm: hypothetical protein vir521_00081 [Caudoviricetes sp. vir521]